MYMRKITRRFTGARARQTRAIIDTLLFWLVLAFGPALYAVALFFVLLG